MFHAKLTESNEEEFKKKIRSAFDRFSTDRHTLNKTDFKCAWLYLFGYKISKYELQEYFEKLNKDYYRDGVSYVEFERKVRLDLKRTDGIEELRSAFMALDFSCKGFLTMQDLEKQFKLIGPHIGPNILLEIMK